jgi:hypothetical protein
MEARSAEPLLAGNLIGEEEMEGLFGELALGGEQKKNRDEGVRLGLGSREVDNRALGGGLCGGDVVGVWGEGSEGCFTAI